jgi:arginase family enzyme
MSSELEAAFARAGELARRSPARVERRIEAIFSRGVPTFMECPRVELEDGLEGFDAVVLGLPFESVIVKDPRTFYPQGTAPPPGEDLYARQGSYDAPAAIRRASMYFSLDHSQGFMPEKRLRIGDLIKLGDAGDLPIRELPPERAAEVAAAAVERIVRAGAFPLVIGGDHLIAYFVLAGIHAATGKKIGVIAYDAHLDLSWEPRYWAGSQWARAMELGALDPRNLVQIGVRGLRNSVFWQHAAEELGVRYFSMADVDRLGLEEVNRQALERARDGADLLYLSVDVDAFEPTVLPAQKYPEPAGFTAREIVRSIEQVMADGHGICGFDFNELGAPYDLDHYGAALAARCLVEVLGGLAARRG